MNILIYGKNQSIFFKLIIHFFNIKKLNECLQKMDEPVPILTKINNPIVYIFLLK